MSFMIRKDKNAQIFFDRNTGLKLRHSSGVYDKSTYPELVDVKITDYCPYKCSFCYQASLPEGKHGSISYIKDVLLTLSQMGVFEIAYGGGEPAEHPKFAEILKNTSELGVVPNFTAFGVSWLKNEELVAAVKNFVGGIGVSVHDVKTANKVEKITKALAGGRTKIMTQHVFGTKTFEETLEITKSVGHILFLGYKTVGFGNRFQPHKFTSEQVIELIKSSKVLSVDTAFVDNYKEELAYCGVKNVLMASPEGKFSCYVDAVEKTMAPSSYVKKSEMIELKTENMFADLKLAYEKW